jgi:hypothetical protein
MLVLLAPISSLSWADIVQYLERIFDSRLTGQVYLYVNDVVGSNQYFLFLSIPLRMKFCCDIFYAVNLIEPNLCHTAILYPVPQNIKEVDYTFQKRNNRLPFHLLNHNKNLKLSYELINSSLFQLLRNLIPKALILHPLYYCTFQSSIDSAYI